MHLIVSIHPSEARLSHCCLRYSPRPQNREHWQPGLPRTLYMDVRPAGPRLRSSPSSCARDLLGLGLGALGAAGGGLAPGAALPRPGVSGLGITWLCASAEVLQMPQALSGPKLKQSMA